MSTVQSHALTVADAVSLGLNPSVWGGGFIAFLALYFEPPGAARALHAALAFCVIGVLPVGALFVLKYLGRLHDVEMRSRSERGLVYRTCLATYVAGALLLAGTGAAWQVWGAVAAHVPATAVLALRNRRSKVSIHAAGLSGMLALALWFFGAAAWPLALVTLAAAVARRAAGAHSTGELAEGAATGLLASAATLVLLRALVAP